MIWRTGSKSRWTLRGAALLALLLAAATLAYWGPYSRSAPPSAVSIQHALTMASGGEGPLSVGHPIRWKAVHVDAQRRLDEGVWHVRFSAAPRYGGRLGERLGFVAIMRVRGDQWRFERIAVEDPPPGNVLQAV